MQCLHEWWGGFGATAIVVLTAVFKDDEHAKNSDTNAVCQEFAAYQLQNCCFLYQEAWGNNPKVS